jgi:hypothetical protein
MTEVAAESVELDEQDVVRALVIDAVENVDTFNADSVKKALEAIDMTAAWTDASDDNRYTDEQLWQRVLNAVCVAARHEQGFDSEMFLNILDDEGVEHIVEEMSQDEDDEDDEDDDDDDNEEDDEEDDDDEEDEEEDEEAE